MASDPTIIREKIFAASTLETIDEAFFRYVDETLDLHAISRDGFKKVPVLWQSAERAYHRKNKIDLRDDNGSLKLPLITISRTQIVKDPARKGIIQANIPPVPDAKGGSITIARRIKQDKTSNFASAMAKRLFNQVNFPFRNEKVVYETVTIPLPVYINILYEVNIKTNYLQQVNNLITPFVRHGGQINYFRFGDLDHRYEAFVEQDFSLESNSSDIGGDEKSYETTIKINVLGYLVGDGPNQEKPKLVYRQSATKIVFGHEAVLDLDGNTKPFPGPTTDVVPEEGADTPIAGADTPEGDEGSIDGDHGDGTPEPIESDGAEDGDPPFGEVEITEEGVLVSYGA